MATEEELDKQDDAEASHAEPAEGSEGKAELRASTSEEPSEDEADEGGTPLQLGYQRYVYATYMAGAMLVAFLVAKVTHMVWSRLGQWKPALGEPVDEILYTAAGLVGVLVAVYYWRKPEARQYTTEVAEELAKVTWPSRKEVTNSTTVVVLATLFATVFFALMDRFWGYLTDQIYSF